MEALETFEDYLKQFNSLNPTAIELIENKFFKLCEEHAGNPVFFEKAASLSEEIIERYLHSPVKNGEKAILRDYFAVLEKQTKELIAAGDLPDLPEQESSLALVPAHHYDPLSWLDIQRKSQTRLPVSLANAFDAAQKRHMQVRSVLESLFKALLMLDRDACFIWKLKIIEAGELDPDLVRDLLRAWHYDVHKPFPPEITKQILKWSDDVNSQRCWPTIIDEADSLMRQIYLHHAFKTGDCNFKHGIKLKQLDPYKDPEKLLKWLRTSISLMGESVDFYCRQGEEMSKDKDKLESWRQDALFRELVWLGKIIPVILVQADLILKQVDGPYEFSMAVFGFTTSYKKHWRECLVEKCRKAVRKLFLMNMRNGEPPMKTIEMLCFDDEFLEKRTMKELDSLTGEFDSIDQREIVVNVLAYNYESYREEPILNQELGIRYRRLMRMIHEDSLNRLLRKEQLEELQPYRDVLLDLSIIASESRKYLNIRQALEKRLDEIIAGEHEFLENVRQIRSKYIRKAILK